MRSYQTILSFLRGSDYREGPEIIVSGDFRVLGDTIEWWPVNQSSPYRYHFLGNDLEAVELRNGDTWIKVQPLPDLVPNLVETEHGRIHPGEYLVHPNHGVGIFEYIVTKSTAGFPEKVFVSLLYAGNDRLLFPWERRQELMPYLGNRHPRLTRLYSKSWEHTKARVEKNLIVIARELLRIYAARQVTTRPTYSPAPSWLEVLEVSVDFSLTPDQEKVLREVQNDLENHPYPMDRLICGDVGFGKTEIALRTAAQVIAAGKQVALIAPTTILVEQHYVLLKKRFANLPIQVGHLSRLTKGKEKSLLEGIRLGRLDIIVGTHRLLGKDIEFKDLGLFILDEEQKFGVAQKERLKQIRPSVDVISLTATPIPRTLSMSLSGLRGLSILGTALPGRLAVKTEVKPYSDRQLRKALLAELKRKGQVYVVHNRVGSLPLVQAKVDDLLRKEGLTASTAMAHGQMDELELATTMSRFLAGEIDVLVASSIVENGLDSPTANTLIVLHSEWFGLSDLYQLRGRVGRRKKQAFAYFFLGGVERAPYLNQAEVPGTVKITDAARKRLIALQEADRLGSGWEIAMRDLEIRGGGNILGHEQHGSMEAVGLLLYAKLLQEEIGRQAKELGIRIFQTKENKNSL